MTEPTVTFYGMRAGSFRKRYAARPGAGSEKSGVGGIKGPLTGV
jgi:hypothetical protein